MKITFDPQVDAMYIRLIDEPAQVTTQRLSEDVAINFAPDGRVVGIEILDTTEYIFIQSQKEKLFGRQND